MKRVLIITYYWPPSGGGGVMRWLKMSKYLPEYGWQPVIYTPANPDPSVIDESLEKEVPPEAEIIRQPIWEPYDLYRRLTGKKKNTRFKAGYISEASRGSFKERISVFIRGNFLIPDPRIFWVKPSVKLLRGYLKAHPVDLIITTGPPHSMHLIGLGLKKKTNIPWLADFRDPWTGSDFYHRLKLTPLADSIHHRQEKKVLLSADYVTAVSQHLALSLEALAKRKVEVVHNGFDPADFDFGPEALPDGHFTISHFGAFNRDRNPATLWKVLGELIREENDFEACLRIRLIGQTDESIIRNIRNEGLEKCLILVPHKNHREGLELLRHSEILLLPVNDAPNARGILPGKMFEYMAMQIPIMTIGPMEGEIAGIIAETQSGFVHHYDDFAGIMKTVETIYHQYKSGNYKLNTGNFNQYSRKSLAGKIINIPFPARSDISQ